MIGSSIAHELSNPLGGMISFIKLIKMDSSKEEAYHADILEMERLGQQCKKLVENLLVFSRRHHSSEPTSVDLRSIVEKSLHIIEVQKKTKSIKWVLELPDKVLEINGQANLLIQAICHVLQNVIDAINIGKEEEEKREVDSIYNGLIKIMLYPSKDKFIVLITSSSADVPRNQSKVLKSLFSVKKLTRYGNLSLTVASKIIAEHGGSLDIHSRVDKGTEIKISFQRLDITSL